MGEECAGQPLLGVVAGEDADYEGVLPTDTVSLSDSDSDDFAFPGDPEVDTISPEEPSPLDDADGEGNDSSVPHRQKSHVQPFHLKGMSSSFSQRSQSIFDCLEGAAKQAVPSMAEDNVIDGRFKRPLPPPTFPNKMLTESLGRQNKPPPSKKSLPAVPDYVAHPERWTKYSLEDVSESSDKVNRSVAMEFLEGLKKTKGEQSTNCPESYAPSFNQDSSSSGAGRIVFTKPTKAGSQRSERKRAAPSEDCEAKITDANEELKGNLPDKTNTQEEEDKVVPGPLKSGGKEVEDWKPPKLEELGVQKGSETDSSKASGDRVVVTVGFHGSKKRDRKHFRPKANREEEEEEA
ncbi:U5 small nuclear ribonucleoprotein TSSC4 [Anolis carolinensis]|uniref:U5 small nuclear ribonucleoprotein TSSC4 n=1 Tax=Anolis carolinensis TaxID=28377 RepID=UPI0001F9DD25|nr:PREDICTED: protein TSSC4 [Anolis carolinensis]XP_016848819.1 PREDICTED: protein TSSC4 [Anolis carolinensis]|eukprot:XP_008106073.1 PREDICTED: protein TSSC4 [Anolis carolinensis]